MSPFRIARSTLCLIALGCGSASSPADDPDPGRCEAAPVLPTPLRLGAAGQPLSGAAVSCRYAVWIAPYGEGAGQVWVHELQSGRTFLTTQPADAPGAVRSAPDLHGFWLAYVEEEGGATSLVLENLARLERATISVVLSDPQIDFHYPWIAWSGPADEGAALEGKPTVKGVWALDVETGARILASEDTESAGLAALDADRVVWIATASRGTSGAVKLRDLSTDEVVELAPAAERASLYADWLVTALGTTVSARDLATDEVDTSPAQGAILAGPQAGDGFATWAEGASGVPGGARVMVWWPVSGQTKAYEGLTAPSSGSFELGVGERLVVLPWEAVDGHALSVEVPVASALTAP